MASLHEFWAIFITHHAHPYGSPFFQTGLVMSLELNFVERRTLALYDHHFPRILYTRTALPFLPNGSNTCCNLTSQSLKLYLTTYKLRKSVLDISHLFLVYVSTYFGTFEGFLLHIAIVEPLSFMTPKVDKWAFALRDIYAFYVKLDFGTFKGFCCLFVIFDSRLTTFKVDK